MRRSHGGKVIGLWWAVVGLSFAQIPIADAATKIRLHLNWFPMGYHVGFFSAMDKGLYAREGLEVEAISGEGSGVSMKGVATRVAEVGITDAGTAVIGRSRGLKVKMVGMFYDRNPMVIYVLKGSGIRTPKDLVGKTLAAPVGSALRVVFPAFARSSGIDPQSVKWLTVTPAAQPVTLATKKADGVPTYIINLPALEKAASQVGEEVAYMWYSDYGLDIYGLAVISSEQWMRTNPDLLRRFLKASYEGIRWAMEHPAEGIEMFLKRRPALDRASTLRTWSIAQTLMITPVSKKHGLGYMDREKMKLTRDIIAKFEGVKGTVELEDLYTNDFLPGIFPPK
ncbi:MAG: ABC transporter substrate-binding protein [Candidatus Tectomicrobia bacterium]|nr:ABC transporter substrate-binding protein [Candidatus Tectomicrobia bacterium]